jgi:excisionase family DNA binding protein
VTIGRPKRAIKPPRVEMRQSVVYGPCMRQQVGDHDNLGEVRGHCIVVFVMALPVRPYGTTGPIGRIMHQDHHVQSASSSSSSTDMPSKSSTELSSHAKDPVIASSCLDRAAAGLGSAVIGSDAGHETDGHGVSGSVAHVHLFAPADRFLTVREVCEYLHCARSTLYRYLGLGLLRSYQPTKRSIRRFRLRDVDAFISNQHGLGSVGMKPGDDHITSITG